MYGQELDAVLAERGIKMKLLAKEQEDLKAKIDSVEDKPLSDTIDITTYKKWYLFFKKSTV